MLFGEPNPFPERGSPTGLRTSGQQCYKEGDRVAYVPTGSTLRNFPIRPQIEFMSFVSISE